MLSNYEYLARLQIRDHFPYKTDYEIFEDEYNLSTSIINELTLLVPHMRYLCTLENPHTHHILSNFAILLCDVTHFQSWKSVYDIMKEQKLAAFNIKFDKKLFQNNRKVDLNMIERTLVKLKWLISKKADIVFTMIYRGLTPVTFTKEPEYSMFTQIIFKMKELGMFEIQHVPGMMIVYKLNLLLSKMMTIFDTTNDDFNRKYYIHDLYYDVASNWYDEIPNFDQIKEDVIGFCTLIDPECVYRRKLSNEM